MKALFRNLILSTVLLSGGEGLLRAAETAEPSRHANHVFLDETAVRNLRLRTEEVEEQKFESTLFALGRAAVLPGKRAVVSSRIPGRALAVRVLPDHPVNAGDPVVILESRQPGELPPQITLTAPISGYVTELAVAVGEPVSPDKALLAVVDLSTVYALAQVPEQYADQIRAGQAVRITARGWPGEVWETRVEHLGVEGNAESGTIEVACHVNNAGQWLRPGMRLEFQLVLKESGPVLAVPRSALQGDAVKRFVFVADDTVPHAFEKVPVVVGRQNDRFVEILNGLLPGDKVVTEGAYPLAFAGRGTVSLKEALDAAHGHEHNEDGSEKTAPSATDHPPTTAPSSLSVRGFSGITYASLAGNAVLLILLAWASRRERPQAGAPPSRAASAVTKPALGKDPDA